MFLCNFCDIYIIVNIHIACVSNRINSFFSLCLFHSFHSTCVYKMCRWQKHLSASHRHSSAAVTHWEPSVCSSYTIFRMCIAYNLDCESANYVFLFHILFLVLRYFHSECRCEWYFCWNLHPLIITYPVRVPFDALGPFQQKHPNCWLNEWDISYRLYVLCALFSNCAENRVFRQW